MNELQVKVLQSNFSFFEQELAKYLAEGWEIASTAATAMPVEAYGTDGEKHPAGYSIVTVVILKRWYADLT